MSAIKERTGTDRFTYVLAVARVIGDKSAWERHTSLSKAIGGNPVRIITFQGMVAEIYKELGTTLAATEVGRMLQMFRASGIDLPGQRRAPGA